jgi:sterol 3beta-glucosyltransferase
MISESGAGPSPIPGKDLTSDHLIEAFKFVHQNDVREAAERLRLAFDHENGCERAVQSFHSRLPLHKMQSDLDSSFGACFYLKDYNLQISRPVVQVLLAAEKIKESQLTVHSTYPWHRLKNDDRLSLPFHNFMRHEQRALRSLFVNAPEALKRTGSQTSFSKGVRDSSEFIVNGIGRASVGCLAFYGDITDTLERLPNVYHRYSYDEQRERAQVNNFQSGMKAAGNSLWYGFKDGITGLVKNPQVGYHHDGIRGVATGTALAIPNLVLKPITGTLASITWLSRGVYAQATQSSEQKKDKRDIQLKLDSSNELRRSMIDLTDETSPEVRASSESGLTIDVCRTILETFEKIQIEHNKMNKSSKETIS